MQYTKLACLHPVNLCDVCAYAKSRPLTLQQNAQQGFHQPIQHEKMVRVNTQY